MITKTSVEGKTENTLHLMYLLSHDPNMETRRRRVPAGRRLSREKEEKRSSTQPAEKGSRGAALISLRGPHSPVPWNNIKLRGIF